jgi:hypothetical protein
MISQARYPLLDTLCLGQTARILIYIYEIARHDSLSLPLMLTPPLARSTSADRPAAPDTAPLPFYLLLLPFSEETKSDSLYDQFTK